MKVENEYEFILKGENDERNLLTDFIDRINTDVGPRRKDTISNAEVNAAEVRMIGYSWGGLQVINTSRKFTQRVGQLLRGYKLNSEIQVESLVTIDPVNNEQFVGVGGAGKRVTGPVLINVRKYRNYYQRRRGDSTIQILDGAGNETGETATLVGKFPTNFVGSVMDADITDKETKRVDTEFANTPTTHYHVRDDNTQADGRLYGNNVNHHTMPWWCYNRAKADLS